MIVRAAEWNAALRDLRSKWQPHVPLPMQVNSAAIMLSVVASGAFGQLTWLLAARLSSPHEVGIASAYMSGALLCAQLSLLGLGSAVIALLPGHRQQPMELLATLLTTVALGGLIAGVLFVLVAVTSLHELGAFVSERGAVLAVLGQAVFLPVALMLDQAAIALRRADGVLLRSIVGGIVRVGLLVALWVVASPADGVSALSITLAWVGSTLLACVLGHAQLRQVLPGFKFRPAVKRDFVRLSLSVGLPNHLVTLASLGPGLIISILVAELLSPTLNAYWYVAWMLAGIVFVVPSSNGLALFAEVANHPQRLRQGINQCIRTSLLFGLPLAAIMGVAAEWVLPMLGESYRAGIAPMRVMSLAVVPMTFLETYLATCRAMRNLAEPAIAFTVSGVLTIAAAGLGGLLFGLMGVAAAWLAAQIAVGAWAAFRLRAMLMTAAAHGSLDAPLTLARDADRRP